MVIFWWLYFRSAQPFVPLPTIISNNWRCFTNIPSLRPRQTRVCWVVLQRESSCKTEQKHWILQSISCQVIQTKIWLYSIEPYSDQKCINGKARFSSNTKLLVNSHTPRRGLFSDFKQQRLQTEYFKISGLKAEESANDEKLSSGSTNIDSHQVNK